MVDEFHLVHLVLWLPAPLVYYSYMTGKLVGAALTPIQCEVVTACVSIFDKECTC